MSYKNLGIGVGFLSVIGIGVFISDTNNEKMKTVKQQENIQVLQPLNSDINSNIINQSNSKSQTIVKKEQKKVEKMVNKNTIQNQQKNSYEAKRQEQYKQKYENFVKVKIAQAQRNQRYVDYYKKQSEHTKRMAYMSQNKDKVNPQQYMSNEQRKLIAFRNWQEQQRMKQAMMNKNIQVNN
jgi:hypothetical protein